MNKEYIEKHEAYLLLKHKAETYMLPATKEAYEKAAILIDSIKAHDVEPVRHGRWIRICGDDYECSECQAAVWSRPPYPIERYKYCWSCGAKMDKEVEE
jgi:hypothetical protein